MSSGRAANPSRAIGPAWPHWAMGILIGCGVAACLTTTVWIVAGIAATLHQNPMAPWMLGRASGFTSYLLMVALVLMGLLMSHPGTTHLRRPTGRSRLRLHTALALFTLVFTALHVMVLATDRFAQVGWRGAILPMASQYRPVAVTLGVVAVWSLVLTAVTAALAGRVFGRIWWPIHRVAIVAFFLVWAHGFLAGSDSATMSRFYLATGGTVLLVGLSRYTTATPADQLDEVVSQRRLASRPEPLEVKQ